MLEEPSGLGLRGADGQHTAAPAETGPTTRQRWFRPVTIFVVLFLACLATALPDGGATKVDPSGVQASEPKSVVVPRLGSAGTGTLRRARVRHRPSAVSRVAQVEP